MVLPFTAKAKFRKIFGFIPGPQSGAQYNLEETLVRLVLHDLKMDLEECIADIQSIISKYVSHEFVETMPGPMKNAFRAICMLEERIERLETRQKLAVALAKKCGFSSLEVYDYYHKEGSGQP